MTPVGELVGEWTLHTKSAPPLPACLNALQTQWFETANRRRLSRWEHPLMAADWDKQAGRLGVAKEGARPVQPGRTPNSLSASTEPIPLSSVVTQPPSPGSDTLEVG